MKKSILITITAMKEKVVREQEYELAATLRSFEKKYSEGKFTDEEAQDYLEELANGLISDEHEYLKQNEMIGKVFDLESELCKTTYELLEIASLAVNHAQNRHAKAKKDFWKAVHVEHSGLNKFSLSTIKDKQQIIVLPE